MRTDISRRALVAGAVALVPTLGLAACGGATTTSPKGEQGSEDTGGNPLGLHSDSGKTLKVVCTNETYKKLFDKFTAEVGSAVEFVSMSSGEVLSKIKAEGGAPTADLWFGGGIDSFMSAKDQGLLEKVDFDAAADFATGFKDEGNHWFSKGLTIVGFIVNDDILAEKGMDKPSSWADLTDTSLKDEILMSTPAVSGTNYAAVNALLQNMGEDAGWRYLAALNENIPYYTKRGSDPSTRVAAGEAAVGITYIDHTLDETLASGSLELVYPSEGLPYMPDGVAAFAGADDLDDARLFIEWLFSSDENLQTLVAIDQKSTILSVLPKTSGIEADYSSEQLMREDLSLFGSQRDDILVKWSEMTSGKEVRSDT